MALLTKSKRDLRHSRRARLGAFVATVTLLSILVVETANHILFLTNNWIYVALAMAAAGLVLLLCAPGRYMRAATPDDVMQFAKNPHYWGLVFLVATVVFCIFSPQAPLAVIAKEPPDPPVQVPPEAPSPVEFPDLSVSGVVLNGEHSSAIINGQVIFLGDGIRNGNVRLVEVTTSAITVELRGVQKKIPLAQNAMH